MTHTKTALLPGALEEHRTDSLLQIHPLEFEANFNRQPFLIGHQLSRHPLLQIDRLLELSKRLPESCIEYNAGNIPISIDGALTPRNGLSPEETIRNIAECRSWLVLKYVERDPEYSKLLEQCLSEIRLYSESITPGMTQPQAFIFVTSPGSVTPYHIDPEHNFLLQIRGSKEVRMLNGDDRSIVSEEDLENFYSDRGRNLKMQPHFEQTGWTFQLQPGQGLHFPVTFPHWVRNGDEVSISFSITFRTPDLDRRRALYQANAAYRGRGKNPRPVGQNKLRDDLIYLKSRLHRRIGSLLQRNAPEQPTDHKMTMR